jgi:hypothetical protein
MLEFGEITLDHNLQQVDLQGTYVNPVVILGTLEYNGPDPSTVRVSNVQSNSFQVQIQEWAYLDGPHTTENLSYMVVEAGHHQMNDGTWYDAGHVSVDDPFQEVPFHGAFDAQPVVFSQIMTDDHSQPMVTRMQGVTANKFDCRL